LPGARASSPAATNALHGRVEAPGDGDSPLHVEHHRLIPRSTHLRLPTMAVREIKAKLTTLPQNERHEVAVWLFHLRLLNDTTCREAPLPDAPNS
jgi:hypothetical protein